MACTISLAVFWRSFRRPRKKCYYYICFFFIVRQLYMMMTMMMIKASDNLLKRIAKNRCFSIFYDVKEHKKQNWRWIFSCFLSVKLLQFSRRVINTLFELELVFQGNLSDHFSVALKDKNLYKWKTFTNPLFLFKIRIPPDLMYCKKFGRFHWRKFKKITNKAIKRVINAFV